MYSPRTGQRENCLANHVLVNVRIIWRLLTLFNLVRHAHGRPGDRTSQPAARQSPASRAHRASMMVRWATIPASILGAIGHGHRIMDGHDRSLLGEPTAHGQAG